MNVRLLLAGAALMASTLTSFSQLPTAQQIAKDMYPGWNLGNTMEGNNNGVNFSNNIGVAGETSWQGTKTSQTVIDFVKKQGFKSVRIPCNWICGHISGGTETDPVIDATWMARVKEVVDYCINAGLYVLLNDHYDGAWIQTSFTSDISAATVEKKSATMKAIWTQIANEFKDYDEHLLFGGLNEPAMKAYYDGKKHTDVQNQVNTLVAYEQAFIDAVRATGGNNATRTLVVQGPDTNIDETCLYMTTMPNDIANHLMIEVHYYSPTYFTGVWENGQPWYFWGKDDSGSSNHVPSGSYTKYNATSQEESYVSSQFAKMKTNYVDKGYPVIIGEYGANWRTLSGNASYQKKHNASIKAFHKACNMYAVNNGCVPFVWDINVESTTTDGIMTVIGRKTPSVFCSYAMDGILAGAKAGVFPAIPEITAISEVTIDNDVPALDTNAPIYNIAGQRVNSDTKGIVIQNGHKFINK